ncbi:hypothetical protein ACLOJK_041404, partial [Asimina triloba]
RYVRWRSGGAWRLAGEAGDGEGSGTSIGSVAGKGTGRSRHRPVAATTGERAGSRQRRTLGPIGVV